MVRTCAREKFSVSYRHSTNHPGGYEITTLCVVRYYGNKSVNADAYGVEFNNHEKANDYCLKRGYTMEYVNERLSTFKRIFHIQLNILQEDIKKQVINAESWGEICDAANFTRNIVRHMGLDTLNAMRFSNGVFTYAQNTRDDLRQKRMNIR